MTLSALVVSLAVDRAQAVRDHMRADPRLTLGPEPEATVDREREAAAAAARFTRQPVVLECSSGQESEDVVRALQALEGVLQVEIVFVDFAPDDTSTSAAKTQEQRPSSQEDSR